MGLRFSLIFSVFCFLGSSPVFAKGIPPESVPLFIVEKNENPENIMVVYTEVAPTCEFRESTEFENQPVFDFYWLMDGVNYKPVHPMIKSNIRQRLEFDENQASSTEFFVKLNDLKEMKHDLSDPRIFVQAARTKEGCLVATRMRLGASMGHAEIFLTSIYAKSKKTLFPPFRKVISVTLKGESVNTGKTLTQTFQGR